MQLPSGKIRGAGWQGEAGTETVAQPPHWEGNTLAQGPPAVTSDSNSCSSSGTPEAGPRSGSWDRSGRRGRALSLSSGSAAKEDKVEICFPRRDLTKREKKPIEKGDKSGLVFLSFFF